MFVYVAVANVRNMSMCGD